MALQLVPSSSGSPGDGALVELFESRREKPSSQIYANLASDPVVSALLRRKEPTYRELVLVVSTVVGALDSRIEELEKAARPWERLSNTLNAPLISAESKGRKKSDEEEDEGNDSEEKPDAAEAKWLLKYLTLRNLGGALVTVLTLSTGFFAFINRDYRSIQELQEKKITGLTEELGVKEKELDKVKDQVRDRDVKNQELEGRLLAADQKISSFKQQVNTLEKQNKAATVTATEQAKLAQDLAEARGRIRELENAAKNASADQEDFRKSLKETEDNVAARSREIRDLENQLKEKKAQLNGAVDSWNGLLRFIDNRRAGSAIEMKAAELRAYLSGREYYTRRVDGMRIGLN